MNEEDRREENKLAEDLGFEQIDIDDVFNQDISTFCKVNPNSFSGSKGNKKGFIIGPTLTNVSNGEQENTNEYYELFCPKVFVRDKTSSNIKKEYRLIIVRYEKITFVLFLNKDQFKLPEEQYREMKSRVIEKAESMSK